MPDFPERLRALEPFWGSWRLDALIGEGSYGKVYRIRRQDMGEAYFAALKWISLPKSHSELNEYRMEGMGEENLRKLYRETVHHLREEIVLMNRLRGNSHIVSYEDHLILEREEEIGWEILIRMELLTPLTRRFETGMTVGDAVQMGLNLCDALTLCGKVNVIHRDIKPDNIFLSEFGEYKLGDFGVARRIEQTMTHMSRQGTPVYMAPEVYLNLENYDATVDLYSLGMVMHRMLNRQRMPFLPMTDAVPTHAERNAALETRLRGVPIPPPVDGGAELAKVIGKACAFQPQKRYQSAEEMRLALEAAALRTDLGQPLTNNPTGAGINSGRSSLTPNWAVPKPEASQETRPKGEPPQKKPWKGFRWIIWLVSAGAVLLIALGIWMSSQGIRDFRQMFGKQTIPPPSGYITPPSMPIVTASEPEQRAAQSADTAPATVPEGAPTPTPERITMATLPVSPLPDRATASPAVTRAEDAASATVSESTPTPTSKQAAMATLLVSPSADTVTPNPVIAPQMGGLQLPNGQVESAVRKACGKADGTLDSADVQSVVTLDLTGMELDDIAFLRAFTGLRELNLSNNRIEDITPLADLNRLSDLYVKNNRIVDIAPLGQLRALTHLSLEGNPVGDISALANLGALEWLNLDRTWITDPSPLRSAAGLARLYVNNTPLTMAQVTALKRLMPGTSINFQAQVSLLTTLKPSAAPAIATTPPADALSWPNQWVEAAVRKACGKKTGEIYPRDVQSLITLDLTGMELDDITFLQAFTGLQVLNLSENRIQDIAPLAGLNRLRDLYLTYNQISDVTPLSGLSALSHLSLENNPLGDIAPLANLGALTWVNLTATQITDPSPLLKLTKLVKLYVDNTPLTPSQITALRQIMPGTSVFYQEQAGRLATPCPSATPSGAVQESGNWLYCQTKDGIAVTGWKSKGNLLIVPEEIEGQPVVRIEKDAFAGNYQLILAVLPPGLAEVGSGAFSDCYSMTSIDFPESLKTIEESAFARDTQLASVVWPSALTEIGDHAFQYCIRLTSGSFPDSLQRIGKYAFDSCYALQEVTLPDSLETIPEYAFGTCKSLSEVQLPARLKTIGAGAFSATNLHEVTIPETVTEIGQLAFSIFEDTNMQTDKLPDGTEIITGCYTSTEGLFFWVVPGSYADQYASQDGIQSNAIV